MNSHVTLQVITSRERLLTLLAFVRICYSVGFHLDFFTVLSFAKAFMTQLACLVFLSVRLSCGLFEDRAPETNSDIIHIKHFGGGLLIMCLLLPPCVILQN